MAAGPDVFSLNRRRWEAQLRAQSRTAATNHGSAVATAPTLGDAPGAGVGIGAGGLSLPSRRSASTGGLIFWRGHPTRNGNGDAEDAEVKGPGMYMPHRSRDRPNAWEWNKHPQFIRLTPGPLQGTPQPYNGRPDREMWEKAAHVSEDGQKFINDKPEYLVRYGERDAFSLAVNDPNKYRIPNTSVVWKEGMCRFPFCKWGFTPLTAAQWIWGLNALCFVVHFVHVFLTLHYAYWRHDMDATNPEHAARMLVRVYRITGIPTPEMIANNQSMGFDPLKRWTNEFYVRDNDMPVPRDPRTLARAASAHASCLFSSQINFATLTLSFFAVSAVAHLWACIVGAHERWCAAAAHTNADCSLATAERLLPRRATGGSSTGAKWTTASVIGAGWRAQPHAARAHAPFADRNASSPAGILHLGVDHGHGHRAQPRAAGAEHRKKRALNQKPETS